MSYRVRVLIAIGGVLIFAFIIMNIRRSKMVIGESVFWVLFSLFLLIVGVFPELIFALARTLHVASASNLAYLIMIALLLIRIFQQDLKISRLQTKLTKLVQDEAIREADEKDASRKQDASKD